MREAERHRNRLDPASSMASRLESQIDYEPGLIRGCEGGEVKS